MASKRQKKKNKKRSKWIERRIKTIPKKKGALNYWERRAIEKEIRVKNKTEAYLNSLRAVFDEATKGIIEDIKEHEENSRNDYIYINPFYALNNMVPKDEAQKVFNNMLAFAALFGLTTKIPDLLSKAYSQRKLNRYKMLQLQVMNRLEAIKQAELKGTVEHLKEVYKETYIETAHELYNDTTGVAFIEGMTIEDAEMFLGKSAESISDEAIDKALKEEFHDKTVEKRIEDNNNKFSEEMQKLVVSEIAQGKSIDRIAQTIQAKMGVKMSDAKRIARTEANRYLSDAAFECYKNAGIEEYIFLATLDYKTSEICQGLDQKVFKVEDREIGVNCNPMHPNCRSTTAPKVDVDIPTRVARGSDGKAYEVDGKMNYKEWWNSLSQKEKDRLEFLKKAEKNKKRDKEQYNRLKKKLGNKAPKSFKEFQETKYYTTAEAKTKGEKRRAKKLQKDLDKQSNQEAIVSKKVIEHPSYKDKFKALGESKKVTNIMHKESKKALKHRNKSQNEDLILVNSKTGAIVRNTKSTEDTRVYVTEEMEEMLKNAEPYSIINIHNHPASSPPSISDFRTIWNGKYKYGLIIGHNGTVYKYNVNPEIVKDDKILKNCLKQYETIYKTYQSEGKNINVFFTKPESQSLQEIGFSIEIVEGEHIYGKSNN